MENIGAKIKERRKMLDISADDLAKAIGKDRATIYRYENSDIGKLPAAILEPLAAALHVSPAWLMGYDDRPAAGVVLSAEEKDVVSKYRKLSPEGKMYIRDQLDFRLGKEAASVKSESGIA